jgi:TatA/E family protein of Tat protein translocase
MLNISPQELLLILLVALLVVGPRRLPELARSLGKGIRELRKAQDEVRKTIQINMDEEAPTHARRPATLPGASSAADGEVPAGADHDAVTGAGVAPAAAAGANDVSEVSRSLGRGLSELRRARKEIQRSFRVDLNEPRPARPGRPPRPTGPAEAPEAADDVAGGPAAGSPPE